MRLLRRTLLPSTLVLLAGISGMGCASQADEEAASEDPLRHGPNSDRWVYNGTLPHLQEPSIAVSLSAHTVRVTGYLPAEYSRASLPFYAKDSTITEGSRTKIAVVYPIATGSSVNHPPDNDYRTERVFPRRTETSSPWGGFPFISYVNDESSYKGIAFHGPITAEDGEWKLIRGPVSHGCNRMQGEHVVELAHLIGVDMTTKVWDGNTVLRNIRVPVTVLRRPDTWNGQNVDVNYPARSQVKRPTENVKMFQAWRSQDFPAWVCKVDARANLSADYCSSKLGLRNRFDPITGPSAAPDVRAPESGCSSSTLGRNVPESACVQSRSEQAWYRCVDGEWVASSGASDNACTERHTL